MTPTLRQRLGALVMDMPRLLWGLRPALGCGRASPWLHIRSRGEVLLAAPDGRGVRSEGLYTRSLHVGDVFPCASRWLLRRCLHDWPIGLAGDRAGSPDGDGEPPVVSFVIGHRGLARLPHLLLTLRSLAAQAEVAIECVVVEQDDAPLVRDELPTWVRHVFQRMEPAGTPYNRSLAFNRGAVEARGRLLVFHDNDMLVPQQYASELVRLYQAGFQVIQPKRFVFYLNERSSTTVLAQGCLPEQGQPESVVANLEGGGSLAIGREAFAEVGGFDEEFVGWGGEDTEFWDRCQGLRVYAFGFVPIVHLWHAPQAGKGDRGNAGIALWARKRDQPREERRAAQRRKRAEGVPRVRD